MSKHEQDKSHINIAARLLIAASLMIASIFTVVILPSPVSAGADTYCQCTNTYSGGGTKVEEGTDASLFADSNGCFCGGITSIIRIALSILTAGIAILGTAGIIWAGVQYLSARDNEGQVVAAKQRLMQTVIGVAAFILFDLVLGLLLPGGAASGTPYVVSSTSTRVKRDISIEKPVSSQTSSSTPPSTSSSPSTSSPSTSSPSTSSPSTSSPGEPSGNDCSDYGVGKGTTYHTQYSDTTRWKGGNCPNCTIAKSGCPMVAILNAIIRVTNCKLTKKMFADHMKEYTNNFTNRRGLFSGDSDWSNYGGEIVKHYASAYKVHIKSIGKSQVKSALQNGHAVVARGKRTGDSNMVFSKGGHYVAFVGISGNTIHVKNPASSNFQNVSFETATQFATDYWEVWK